MAIGVFDGVHLGHSSLLEAGRTEARRLGAPFRVLTFWPHPETVLAAGDGGAAAEPVPGAGFLLTTLAEKTSILETLGVESVLVLRFTTEAASITPEDFVERTLCGGLRPRTVIVGFNFSFGARGRGRPALLAQLGRKAGFGVLIHPAVKLDGEVVSSTAVRAALSAGDVVRAELLLGRSYCLAGRVVKGEGRGRRLGFPTANVAFPPELACPASGVYVCRVFRDGLGGLGRGEEGSPAVANVGVAPTFPGPGQKPLRLEVHVLGGNVPTYGDVARVSFLQRLRPESRFSGAGELSAQIAADVARARAFFGGLGHRSPTPVEDSGRVNLRRFGPGC